MRKKTVIGAFFVIFLMLMTPILPALELKSMYRELENLKQETIKTLQSQNDQIEQSNTIDLTDNETEEYYALIVGCTEYEDWWHSLPPFNPLPEYTMKYMYNSLLNTSNWNEENMFLLLNENATKRNIVNTFAKLSKIVDENDVFVFSWMGHGSYVNDDDGDEIDGYDEVICPYDTKTSEEGYHNLITDDELDVLFSSIKAKGQFIMFESCLSGGMVDVETPGNFTLVDTNQDGRVVVMSTPAGKLGFGMNNAIGWPMAFLYGQALSNPLCNVNNDGWISAEEAFAYVDSEYPIFEQKWKEEFFDQSLEASIIYDVILQFLIANKMLKKVVSKPMLRTLLSALWALIASKIYSSEKYRDLMFEMFEEIFDIRMRLMKVENNPNIADGYPGELPIISLP